MRGLGGGSLLIAATLHATWIDSTHSFSSSPSSLSQSQLQQPIPKNLPNVRAALIVPGFLSGENDFRSLAESLNDLGIPTAVVPMPRWHWIPCLGGRSMRPIMERIDHSVRHLTAILGETTKTTTKSTTTTTKEKPLHVPKIQYSFVDCWNDFWTNPGGVAKVGGSAIVDDYPHVDPCGTFPLPSNPPKGRIAIIGHSAGGWIARAYLSRRSYGGRAYCGADLVHSLVTLGTPHAEGIGPAFYGVEWTNREGLETIGVDGLAVGGTGLAGDSSGDLTQGSYAFCCPDGSDGTSYDGDGVTPIWSSVAWKGAETMVVENVTHFPWSEVVGGSWVAPELTEDHKNGLSWYGSEGVIDQWASWLRSRGIPMEDLS